MQKPDVIEVEILEDGSLKISTDEISMANHGGAEILIREMVKAAGGESKRINKPGLHRHQHNDVYHTH